jgi:hypothetical protein
MRVCPLTGGPTLPLAHLPPRIARIQSDPVRKLAATRTWLRENQPPPGSPRSTLLAVTTWLDHWCDPESRAVERAFAGDPGPTTIPHGPEGLAAVEATVALDGIRRTMDRAAAGHMSIAGAFTLARIPHHQFQEEAALLRSLDRPAPVRSQMPWLRAPTWMDPGLVPLLTEAPDGDIGRWRAARAIAHHALGPFERADWGLDTPQPLASANRHALERDDRPIEAIYHVPGERGRNAMVHVLAAPDTRTQWHIAITPWPSETPRP